MATLIARKKKKLVGPESNGRLMTPEQFDRADFEEGWRYELINGVLIVSPTPSLEERDPNEELGRWLRNYQERHPKGSALNFTVHEHTIRTRKNRRRADRAIWAGLGRLPRKNETPTIAVEFVSSAKSDRERDYEAKRKEYMAIRIKEYWIIDRFERSMVVHSRKAGKLHTRVIREHEVYQTALLPGFEVSLSKLLALADRWADFNEEKSA